MAASSGSQNKSDSELTMCDVLEEEQELEEDANAVLGGSDDTNCSYDKGYVPRQALYACITCSADQEPAGVCLACSYKCHDGHEIVELYTKRNFRCDCGNSKFSGKTCSLKPEKDPVNVMNKYNQNFKGLYCSCARPYPDLEDDTPDEMIQCVMCEDWYHGRHIGSVVPDDYFEMICGTCMQSHKFLYAYLNKFHYVNVKDEEQECKDKCNGNVKPEDELEKKSVNQVLEKNSSTVCENPGGYNIKSECLEDENKTLVEQVPKVEAVSTSVSAADVKCSNSVSAVNSMSNKEGTQTNLMPETSDCAFSKLSIKPDGIKNGPAFWPDNWRKDLCCCSSCMDMYKKLECDYLVNLDDTILAYEERGKSTNESQYDKGLNALSQLDRVKQMEAVRAYTSMKGQLKEYLKDFANNKRTVCESDIKEFFERISKRQKTTNGVPHFCR